MLCDIEVCAEIEFVLQREGAIRCHRIKELEVESCAIIRINAIEVTNKLDLLTKYNILIHFFYPPKLPL
jgi:hypothetical protein